MSTFFRFFRRCYLHLRVFHDYGEKSAEARWILARRHVENPVENVKNFYALELRMWFFVNLRGMILEKEFYSCVLR